MKTILCMFLICSSFLCESVVLSGNDDTMSGSERMGMMSICDDDDLKDYGHWVKEWSKFEEKYGLCMWNNSYDFLYVEYCVVVNGKKITDSLILSPGTRRTIYFDAKDFKVVYVMAKVHIG